MKKSLMFAISLMAMTGAAYAVPTVAPEMDPSSAITALTLLAGGLAMLRGRRQR
jgi:hypothetical protein